jgi:FkbM family methyltransferase
VIATLKSPEIRLLVSPLDHGHFAVSNLNYRKYETEEVEMLLSLARDGDTFFDVGANVGVYSIAFAQQFSKSRIYAFEPIPDTARKLKENILASGVKNVSVEVMGLSDVAMDARFYTCEKDSGAASLAPLEEERFGKEIPVLARVQKLDNYVYITKEHPDIIKCDVEGAELLVFRGAARTLERYHPIIQCEMLRKWAKRFIYHPNNLIDYLATFGYRCYTLRDGKLVPFQTMTDETVETNFYFLTEEHKERIQ